MSHSDEHGHGTATTAGGTAVFSPEEIAALHEDDIKAGGNIVKLMLGIFLCGVAIYSVVALVVAG